ncbi:MAG: Gfo/Idh/MocA family oxidoreductase [Deltaproteobacteria bacterium]|nr:Gfo/Idh/MocA family oxidoreductase [Deltaproteobacteria bacterium]
MNIGLIGCGKWGRNILRDLLSLGCRVIVADPSRQARETALRMGAEFTIESGSAMDRYGCDGYVIASPILTLANEAEMMLRCGKPVFCEKPVFTADEEKERLKAAGATERLFAMYKFCYHPGIEALRAIIASEELGPAAAIILQRLNWDDDFQGTDCLWLAGVHQLSIVQRLLGYIPEPEMASVSLHDGIVTAASITLGNTLPVTITLSSRYPSKVMSVTVLCSRGAALLPDAYAGAIVIRKDGHENEQRPISEEMSLLLELKDFLGYLQNGNRPRCGFDIAASVSSTIGKIRRIATVRSSKPSAA